MVDMDRRLLMDPFGCESAISISLHASLRQLMHVTCGFYSCQQCWQFGSLAVWQVSTDFRSVGEHWSSGPWVLPIEMNMNMMKLGRCIRGTCSDGTLIARSLATFSQVLHGIPHKIFFVSHHQDAAVCSMLSCPQQSESSSFLAQYPSSSDSASFLVHRMRGTNQTLDHHRRPRRPPQTIAESRPPQMTEDERR